jgi:hypothetical protein
VNLRTTLCRADAGFCDARHKVKKPLTAHGAAVAPRAG